jgi:predicted PurR-regulated permease PerM
VEANERAQAATTPDVPSPREPAEPVELAEPVDSAEPAPREPPWLRRALVLTLAAVAAYQVATWAFHGLRSFLGLLFLSFMFAISLEPVVRALVRRGMRRGLATGVVLVGTALLVVGLFAAFGALLVDQVRELVGSLPDVIRDAIGWANRTLQVTLRPQGVIDSLDLTGDRIRQLVQGLTPSVVQIVTALVSVVFQTFTFLLFSYYMSADGPALRETVSRWFPPRQQRVISAVWAIAVEKAGGYVLSRLVLAAISATATAAFLWLLGVPFWLPLGLWTGLVSQFIPTIGTYLAIAAPALVALAKEPIDALWVIIFATAYQQVENFLLAPRITAQTVRIHPAVAFGSVIAGASLFGPLGALFAIPVVAVVQAVIETYGHRYEYIADDEARRRTSGSRQDGDGSDDRSARPEPP